MVNPAVVILGAGPAGTRAANTFVNAGIHPTIIDESPKNGGQVYRQQPSEFKRSEKVLYGFEAKKAIRLQTTFENIKNSIDYLPETLVWNIHEKTLYTEREGETSAIPFDVAVLAPGATDLVMPFSGWSKAGVFTLGGAQVALKYQACSVGRRTAFVGTGPLLYLVAYQYLKAGADVAAVIDTSPMSTKISAFPRMLSCATTLSKGFYYMASLWSGGIPLYHGATPIAVSGESYTEGLTFRDGQGVKHTIKADAVAIGFGLKCENQLADLAHCEFFFDPPSRQWLPMVDRDGRTNVEGLYLAGDGRHIAGADAAELTGELAAFAALEDLGQAVPLYRLKLLRRRLRQLAGFRNALEKAFPFPVNLIKKIDDSTLLCRCEEVTAGEVRKVATAYGANEVNKVKAFTRVGMGRCQGRFCGHICAELVADTLKIPIQSAGRLRAQAPVKPISIAGDSK